MHKAVGFLPNYYNTSMEESRRRHSISMDSLQMSLQHREEHRERFFLEEYVFGSSCLIYIGELI